MINLGLKRVKINGRAPMTFGKIFSISLALKMSVFYIRRILP
jgi:hypothetical protein